MTVNLALGTLKIAKRSLMLRSFRYVVCGVCLRSFFTVRAENSTDVDTAGFNEGS